MIGSAGRVRTGRNSLSVREVRDDREHAAVASRSCAGRRPTHSSESSRQLRPEDERTAGYGDPAPRTCRSGMSRLGESNSEPTHTSESHRGPPASAQVRISCSVGRGERRWTPAGRTRTETRTETTASARTVGYRTRRSSVGGVPSRAGQLSLGGGDQIEHVHREITAGAPVEPSLG